MSNLLDNFFVSLGWKIDEASFRKQRDLMNMTAAQRRQHEKEEREREKAERQREVERARRLEASIVRANLFASAIEGMAKSVVRSVADIASGFETMFYASQRTGQSVQNLKATAYAVSQLGGSYDSALQSMENFGRNIRNNPGYETMLNQLGVKTRGAGNKLLEQNRIADEFFKKTASMPYYLARDYASDLGFDEATFRAFREQRVEVQKFQDQYDRSAERFGLDNEKAKVSGQQFMQTLRGLQQTATVLSEKFYSDLAPSLTRVAERFQNWIDTHPDQINAALEVGEKIVLSFAHAVEWLGGKIGPVIVQIGDWAKAITGKDGLQDTLDNFATWVLGFWAAKIIAGFLKVGGGWAAMLLRLGIPAGIAIAASGGGHETPEQYRESLQNDPARAQADAELNKNGGAAKRWWKRNMPTWLGGDPASTTGGASSEKSDYNFTGSNADILRQAAKELGTSPEDLATVISYESKFRSNVWGGKGGNYLGLIQFGAEERRQFGVNENQTFAEQMPSVVKFLKSRGFKPGMGLLDLYSTINAGRPGLYDRSDGNGTVRSHAERMAVSEAARVQRFLSSTDGSPASGGQFNMPVTPMVLKPESMGGVSGRTIEKMVDVARNYDFTQSRMQFPGGNTYNSGATNNVTASPNVTINVTGGGSAQDTAGTVARAMEGVNKSSVRDVQGALR